MSVFNVIAYLLTDGGIDSQGRIYFANNDLAVIEDFKQQATSAFGNLKFGYTKARKSTIVRFSNKSVKNLLLKYSPSFRTRLCQEHPKCRGNCLCDKSTGLPPTKVPEEILNADKEAKKEFLSRIFTGDGGPVLTYRKRGNRTETRRMVVLRCNHPTLLESYKKMLSEFGINFRINGTQIQIERLDSLRKFRESVNFLPNAKVGRGKNWVGVEKRQVLDKMLM